MPLTRHAAALLAILLLAPAVSAGMRRDALGPRSAAPVLRVNGIDISPRMYASILRDGETSWRWLREMYTEEQILKKNATREEYLVQSEFAEPSAMARMFAEQVEPFRQQALRAYERARAGENWDLLVETYATEPDASARRGDLGVVAFDNLVPPFGRVMFEAPLGVVQPPVQTIFGWHVGKVTEILAPRDIVRADGTTVRRPETRRVSQILITWALPDEPTGERSDLRLELMTLEDRLTFEVIDRAYCSELPTWCERAPISATPAGSTR